MATNQGKTSRLARGLQTDIATFPTAMRLARYYSSTIEGKQDDQPDDVIGATAHNDFDTVNLQRDMETVDGAMEFPLCANQTGDVLTDIFGLPVTTGTNPTITHTFSSGAATAPRLFGQEIKISATRQRRHVGLVARSFSLSVAKENGIQRFSISVIGRQDLNASTAFASPGAERAYLPLNKRTARIQLNGAAAPDIMSGSFEYNTGVEAVPYLDGTEFIGAIERDNDATVSGSISVRTDSNTYHALGDTATDHTVAFIVGSGNSMMTITVRGRFSKKGQPVSGRGPLVTEFAFKGQVGASAPMVTVALVNSLAALSYV
jgi:hypothetical protein